MGTKFANGKKALALCDRCGLTYLLRKLRKETLKGRVTNVKVCNACWDSDHPQLRLGEFPVDDPQALRDARPDIGVDDSRELTVPGGGTVEDYINAHT